MVKLVGNQATYSSYELGDRTIRLTFFNGGACVDYAGGFEPYEANQATVTGNYIRTDTKAPAFPKIN